MKQKEPIRVAHIVGKWIGGGVESVIMNYYRRINRNDIQFDFFCDEDSTCIPFDEIERLGGKVILIPPYQKVLDYHKYLKARLSDGNYKLVHSHINTLSVFSLFAAKRAGIPIRIAHSHSTTSIKESKRFLLKQFLRPFSKLFATEYMCCSERAGRWLFGNREYEKGCVYLLNNAIDIEKFKFNKEIREFQRIELNIDEDTLVIGHIGRFVETKNHDFLLNIFKELLSYYENSILLLVGDGPLVDNINDKLVSLGIADKAILLGQRTDVYNLYQAFDVFCLPSLYEGLPVVGVEAQIASLPCVFSNTITKEVMIHENIKFVSLEKSSKDWASEIYNLYVGSNRLETTSRKHVEKFDIEKEVDNLTNYYLKLYQGEDREIQES